MPLHNADIAAIFGEIADLLEIRGENPLPDDVLNTRTLAALKPLVKRTMQ